ncbi:hypothetical protein G7Y79_00034g070080 [Physcia stellaris]|nr:hypothetical protein G7Y79_00034g070080 [Physcia stellaris]
MDIESISKSSKENNGKITQIAGVSLDMRKVTGNMDRHQVATLLEDFNIGIAEHIALPNPYVEKKDRSQRKKQLSKANVVSLANLPDTLDAWSWRDTTGLVPIKKQASPGL